MKKSVIFLIAALLILPNAKLHAQDRYFISLGKIRGLEPKYLYCAGEDENNYRLYVGTAESKKRALFSAFVDKLKNDIARRNSISQQYKKLKRQLKVLKSLLKPALLRCKSEIQNKINSTSLTPTLTPTATAPTVTTLHSPTPTISICGNALIEPGEECDDGDTSNQNACLNNCKRSFCGDGFLQSAERCIIDDPIASSYVKLKRKLSAQFCENSESDRTLNAKQADLMAAINFMLSGYLKNFTREALATSFTQLSAEIDDLLASCRVSNFTPLSVSQLKSIINEPSASEQTSLLALSFQHHLVSMSCSNYAALSDHQFSNINYLGDFYPEIYKWYLDFIEHCEDFKAGRIYDIALDNAFSEGLNLQVTYSTCEGHSAFAPNSSWIDDNLKLTLIYPNLSLTCLQPKILSKPVYVYTGSRIIDNFKVTFYDFEKKFQDVIQKTSSTNLVPLKAFLDLLPRSKTTIMPGMYDGFYSYPIDSDGRDLPFKVIGLTNIADDLWRQLKQIAPPNETRTLVDIFQNYSYDPAGKSIWGQHPLIRNLDFSGVAWENNKSGTLISRQHILVAAHFRRDVGDTVMFHDRSGNPVVRRVVAIKSLDNDICIAKLDSPVPAGVTHYKLLYNNIDIIGAPVIVTDRFFKVGIMQITSVWKNHGITADGSIYGTHDRWIGFMKPSNEYKDVNRQLTGGDSGHPTFLVINGELVLLETHTTANSGPNFSSFWNQDVIRQAIADLN